MFTCFLTNVLFWKTLENQFSRTADVKSLKRKEYSYNVYISYMKWIIYDLKHFVARMKLLIRKNFKQLLEQWLSDLPQYLGGMFSWCWRFREDNTSSFIRSLDPVVRCCTCTKENLNLNELSYWSCEVIVCMIALYSC